MKNLKKLYIASLFLFGFGQASAQTDVVFYTSMGDIEIKLTDALTPVTVDSFLARVDRGFYDGLIFHRVIDNFMIQGGDPSGNGTGGTGTTIPDEFDATLKNVPGALAMANIGSPNTGDCQFFINLVTNNHLDNKHTVFGMVTTGFDIVQDIGKVPVSAGNNKPLTDVVIDSIRVKKAPTTSIANANEATGIRIYPNPAGQTVHMDLPDLTTNIEIINMNGQTVFSAEARGAFQADVGGLPAGVYLLKITDSRGVLLKTERLMKMH